MKKIVTLLIFGLMSLASCTEYDEVAMWNKNEDMGSRLAALERLCDRMNTNIASLQRIVEALQDNDYVTGVAPVVENGETIGYTISFSRSEVSLSFRTGINLRLSSSTPSSDAVCLLNSFSTSCS